MHDCPNCRLVNPDSALRCDCGFDFSSRTVQASYLSREERRRNKQLQRPVWLDRISDLLFLASMAYVSQEMEPVLRYTVLAIFFYLTARKYWFHQGSVSIHLK